jgi:hypothetical protein
MRETRKIAGNMGIRRAAAAKRQRGKRRSRGIAESTREHLKSKQHGVGIVTRQRRGRHEAAKTEESGWRIRHGCGGKKRGVANGGAAGDSGLLRAKRTRSRAGDGMASAAGAARLQRVLRGAFFPPAPPSARSLAPLRTC